MVIMNSNISDLVFENYVLQDQIDLKDIYIECMNIEYTGIVNEDSSVSMKERLSKVLEKGSGLILGYSI